MSRHYTDAENTGLPAVPRPTSTDTETSGETDAGTETDAEFDRRRETMTEAVWSHRLDGGAR
ncbi:hypothetical protein [Candidatus Halobonum tyrrellensis]|uniref:Uncharacterized protein n=1 Tax=Candidatus Halobonum tyrrellensis G22 TaxID=1324957 RepID=V4GNT3_9EURY|nr:hypothetical protein [Candidatus Halobonum tyrrellensis]ESP87051.1 hypothetical protein K933_16067 [Candidatus Halobonum tyrrellensis G22]